jgi:hypothetical protein
MSCTTPSCCTGNCRQGRDCPNRSHSARGSFALLCIMLLCFAGLLAIVGPAIDDHSGEAAQADAAIDQIKRERREVMAARAICGENAGYQFNGNALQCFTKRGAKTMTAKVTP